MDPHSGLDLPESSQKPFRKTFYESADPNAATLLANIEALARDTTADTADTIAKLESGVKAIEGAEKLDGKKPESAAPVYSPDAPAL